MQAVSVHCVYILSGNPVAMGASSISTLRMEKSGLSCGVPRVTSHQIFSESSSEQTIMVVQPQSPSGQGGALPLPFFLALGDVGCLQRSPFSTSSGSLGSLCLTTPPPTQLHWTRQIARGPPRS